MASNEQEFLDQIKAGDVNLEDLKEMSSESLTSPVHVSDWGLCYSSATGQLSGFCTVTPVNGGDSITGNGFIIYQSNGSTMICLHYTNGFTSTELMTSVGTNLYTSSMGDELPCIVYGWTQNSGNYFIYDTLKVNPC